MTVDHKLPEQCDILIVGGGPAGLAAAIEAAGRALHVVLVDENPVFGGQLIRQIHKFFGSSFHYAGVRGIRIADMLSREASEAGCLMVPECRALGFLRDGRVALSLRGAASALRAKRILLAVGGKEHGLPFPGWTLPGVMTAGAAQTLCNLHHLLPGRHVLMVGSGNVGLIVSYQLMQAGACIAAIVDTADRIGGYAVHAAKLQRAGVPFFLGAQIQEAIGLKSVQRVNIGINSTGEHLSIDADAVLLATGLSPRTELASMFGCELTYEPRLGGHFPRHDDTMRSSVSHVFVAGDSAGVEEAATAIDEGRLAGLSMAFDIKGAHCGDEKMRDEIRSRLKAFRNRKASSGKEKQNCSAAAVSPGLVRYPVFECVENIACNPCADACPAGAITVETITSPPVVDYSRCTGCMRCLSVCPGQAVFMVDRRGSLTLAWEYLPVPSVGEKVILCGRSGEALGMGNITACRRNVGDKTMLVTLSMDSSLVDRVRSFKRCGDE
ncbi:FAD-dependent oxidoreductase [Sediminispirochaeta bajacaliforniensis]|uniref:FAD-dependent oxidoreductase n=1 Tax=Sediminispirochaeta bajacaliforniensis TaxID=148 RepID=UPI00036036F6|nr:FAD-dependent oxidoreductase [Sediminispirochaeta bajacaliforniensis]